MIAKIAAAFSNGVARYSEIKFALEKSLPFDADLLHLVIGPVIFLLSARLTRGASLWWPWLTVVVLAVLNEAMDFAVDKSPDRTTAYIENATDFLLTIAVPTFFLIAARFFPRLFGGLLPGVETR